MTRPMPSLDPSRDQHADAVRQNLIPRAPDDGKDPFRPRYHFTAPKNWLNDPNGLIRWNGWYHLFYQHHPYTPNWGPMHWGHAVSRDLIHWRDLPVALRPEKKRTPDDESGIFSGSAVDDGGVLTLIYTEFADPKARRGKAKESQSIATSTDGVQFVKFEGNPVVAAAPPEATRGFRDPKAWKDDDGLWKMVVGSGHNGRGKALLYGSEDLRSWTYLGVLLEGDGTTGTMWECPDLFPLPDPSGRTSTGKHALFVSVNEPGYAPGTYCVVGVYDYREKRFFPERWARADFGPDFYAAQTFPDEDGRRIAIGWLNRWGAEMPSRKYGWAGMMSLPREVFLMADGSLGVRPVREVKRLRQGDRPAFEGGQAGLAPDSTRVLDVTGESLEVRAVFEAAGAGGAAAERFGLEVRRSPDGAEKTVVYYDAARGKLGIDRESAGLGDGGRYETDLALGREGRLELRVFVDRSSVEVFADGGRAAGSCAVYPKRRESQQIAIFAEGGGVRLDEAQVYRLTSIWETREEEPA